MAQKASEQLVDVLIDWHVKHVYGLPGDSIDTTVDALRKQQDQIGFVQVRHEEVASLAAAAEAKLTGKLGVCLSIGGPGAIHMLNGLYDAKMDHVPVLALLGQVDTQFLNEEYFQEVNTPQLFADVAVYNKLISATDNLAEIVDEAIRTAYEKHGVAVLTIPDNLPEQRVSDHYISSASSFQLTSPQIDENRLNTAAKLICDSKKPLALVGLGAKKAGSQVAAFLEQNNIPFISTLPAKGIIGDNHPNSLGNVGKLGTKPAYEAMQNTDLLLMFGTNYPYTAYLPKPGTAKSIQINTSASAIGKRYPADVGLVADIKDVIKQLNSSETTILHPDDGFLKACQENVANWNRWMTGKRELDSKPVAPEALFNDINETAPLNTIYSIDVGTATSWSARFLNVSPTQKFILSSYLGTMGCALPGAIAAKINYPDRPVISVNGDGAFAMVMQDFITAVKYKLPLINIVLNNSKLAFIEYEQQAAGQLNYQIDLQDMDYAKFADAAGGVGITAKTSEEFKNALNRAYRVQNMPVLINAYVSDDAPLPGKIVGQEAKGYMKFGSQYLKEEKKIPELPPLKDILRQFF